MYRDPSEFRERFKAYKDGKSVREIYGLPGYEPGKLPVEEMMPYILAVENPTKQGLVNGVWRPPTDSTKWDVHAIGGGLDIREQHNPIVYNYLKTNGRLGSPFLTAREEEVLREKVFKKTMLPALQNVYNKYGDKISSKGYARLAGMKWQGHPFLMAISPDSVTGKAFIKAIESGDKDLDSVFDAYYKYPANAKRYATRILADTNYWKNHNIVATKPFPQEPIIARLDATRVSPIPTVELKAIDYTDRRNTFMAEAERLLEVKRNMANISNMIFGQQPIYKSTYDIPTIELDQAEFKTTGHKDGKLPGYQEGLTPQQIEETIVKDQGTIQQGHRLSPLSTVANSMYRDYRKPFAQLFTEGGLGNFAGGAMMVPQDKRLLNKLLYPTFVNSAYLLNEQKFRNYKDGKISIKPANRGKFNATKKRTGKTTEELTHSKNPLTRKRAIFALNARKWHHADGKLPNYEDGRPRITTGGAGVTSVYLPAPNSPEVQPTVDLLERIANFLPYVGTIQDWEQVVNGNIGKVPSAVIGTVADVFLPGLRSSYKAAKAYEAASKAAPKFVDKIKYYKASQKAYKKTAANVGYLVAGTYEDILDDLGYQFPLFINK